MAIWNRNKGPALPEDWAEQASRSVRWFDALIDEERYRIGELAGRLLSEKDWEAAQGFELTEEIRLTIALQAALLVLGLSFDHYRMAKTIIVHPTTMVSTGERAGPVPGVVSDDPLQLLGQAARAEGPMVIAWDEARRNARHPERGHDVVFHEFAHKLDMLDHVVDGTPPLGDEADRRRWIDVCTAELEDLRAGQGGHLLSAYGGQDPGEFFAVATEVFFDRPIDLRKQKPDLYDVLSAFYNQDPATAADAATG